MRIGHFETLKPVCPRCKSERQVLAPLSLANVSQQTGNIILEGSLVCSNAQCATEYPIIDGIPIILNTIRKYINENFYHITARDDLTAVGESLLGDYSGPGSEFNSMRHYLSTYAWDHYGDKAPENEFKLHNSSSEPGSVVNCLQAGFSLLDSGIKAPALDVGCAVGRSSFEVAERCGGLTLGIDLNFSLLRVAQKVLRDGRIRFPLKRTGIVFDRHEFSVKFTAADKVDFWVCDASNLPFDGASFNFVSALNVLDTVNSPAVFLQSINDTLACGGRLLLSTPYDWSPPVPLQNWFGGHAQRSAHQGSSETVLRNQLSPELNSNPNFKLKMIAEIEHHPWRLRVHSRRTAHYDTHILAIEKACEKDH